MFLNVNVDKEKQHFHDLLTYYLLTYLSVYHFHSVFRRTIVILLYYHIG